MGRQHEQIQLERFDAVSGAAPHVDVLRAECAHADDRERLLTIIDSHPGGALYFSLVLQELLVQDGARRAQLASSAAAGDD